MRAPAQVDVGRTLSSGGAEEHTTIKSFCGAGPGGHDREDAYALRGDEPPVLLGTNTAPNAVEALLSALAGCMTVAFIYPASAEGVKVESLEYMIDGDVDLQGFLQLSDKVRPGLQNIRVRAKIKADASREKIQALLDYAAMTSVVMDTIRNPTSVSVELA